MNLIGGLGNQGDYPVPTESAQYRITKPRVLTEQLNDKIAYHENEILKLKEALSSLTPDVQKALDALSKL